MITVGGRCANTFDALDQFIGGLILAAEVAFHVEVTPVDAAIVGAEVIHQIAVNPCEP
jgi:hypothetical protein